MYLEKKKLYVNANLKPTRKTMEPYIMGSTDMYLDMSSTHPLSGYK